VTRPRARRALVAVLAFSASLGAAFASGCVKVAPYEREHLAKPSMDFARESREIGFRSHVHESREGATGGYGAAGGGCGCN
jgi:hypothetical protein